MLWGRISRLYVFSSTSGSSEVTPRVWEDLKRGVKCKYLHGVGYATTACALSIEKPQGNTLVRLFTTHGKVGY